MSAADLPAIKADLERALAEGTTFSKLTPIQARLDAVDAARYKTTPPDMSSIADVDECYDLLARALDAATDVDASLQPTLATLAGVKKDLDRLAHAKHGHTLDDVVPFQRRLDAIDATRTNGVFGDPANPPAGQAAVVDALEACYALVASLQDTATPFSGRVDTVYCALRKHKAHLQSLIDGAAATGGRPDTHAEMELKKIQGHLGELDDEAAQATPRGWGVENGVVPPGQAAISELMADCHALIEKFQEIDA